MDLPIIQFQWIIIVFPIKIAILGSHDFQTNPYTQGISQHRQQR
jgi:hypothetical protein